MFFEGLPRNHPKILKKKRKTMKASEKITFPALEKVLPTQKKRHFPDPDHTLKMPSGTKIKARAKKNCSRLIFLSKSPFWTI